MASPADEQPALLKDIYKHNMSISNKTAVELERGIASRATVRRKRKHLQAVEDREAMRLAGVPDNEIDKMQPKVKGRVPADVDLSAKVADMVAKRAAQVPVAVATSVATPPVATSPLEAQPEQPLPQAQAQPNLTELLPFDAPLLVVMDRLAVILAKTFVAAKVDVELAFAYQVWLSDQGDGIRRSHFYIIQDYDAAGLPDKVVDFMRAACT